MLLPYHINPHRFGKATKIDAVVLEKFAVFDGQHRINQDLGDIVVFDHLPLRALVALRERCDHLGFELVSL